MAYVHKIIAQDENLIGIARLHWIYVIKGLGWFLTFAGAGWVLDQLASRGLLLLAQATGANAMAAGLMNITSIAMMFMMAGGVFIFLLMVMKVLVTEIALTNRRIIHKEGWIFVKVKQVDLEEIRGENMDLGHLGRLLGYAYVMLDCRFIGDVRLPAIENPERFMRALHQIRGVSQDTLSVVLGKNSPKAVGVVATGGPDTPQPATPQPEIQPGQMPAPEVAPPATPQPEIQPPPVPHSPPPAPPPAQPQTPPPPAQPTPPPTNPEPPLQPPSGVSVPPTVQAAAPPQPPEQAPPGVALSPEAVAQVVQQVMPQMAEQVVKQMAEQGLVRSEPAATPDIDVDTDLIDSFDDAAKLDKGGNNDLRDKVEHAIH